MECVETKQKQSDKLSLLNYINNFAEVIAKTCITASSNELDNEQALQVMQDMLHECRENNGTVYIAGNGGSAAIASHAVIDFMNMDEMKAVAMLDPAVTTCISNDYGYEHIYERQVSLFAGPDDVLIAISSSGNSQNIVNAVTAAKAKGAKTITFSGFGSENALRTTGDINLWLDSTDYGQVEIGHAFLLHNLTDRLRIKE